jgi:hypothetical protein
MQSCENWPPNMSPKRKILKSKELASRIVANERGRQLRRPYLRGRLSSFDKSDRKSASAWLPANCAAMSD